MGFFFKCTLLLAFATLTTAQLSFFNVVKFPNAHCDGGSRNGTCYTAEECSDRGGVNSGSCAEGYGVCCVIQVACGGSSSENCTYLVQAQTSTPSDCSYKICPMNKNVCRIKFELMTFTISAPVTDTINNGNAGLNDDALGECSIDSFAVSGSLGGGGSPVICGSNSGQHLYVDVDGMNCANANFNFNDDAVSRQYDIRVLQYDCRNEFAGPTGCLQYFTGSEVTFTSFNFIGTASGSGNFHLANQDYDICFRAEKGMCGICYTQTATMGAFGLSLSSAAGTSKSIAGAGCATDYLVIPHGVAAFTSISSPVTLTEMAMNSRFCGHFLAPATTTIAAATVCSRQRPFRVSFVTDGSEVQDDTAANTAMAKADMTETSAPDAINLNQVGVWGFSLSAKQIACP